MDKYEDFKKDVYNLTKIDLNAYKEQQMKRRIDSLIFKHDCKTYKDYVNVIKNDNHDDESDDSDSIDNYENIYFKDNTGIKQVKLNLPNATNCDYMFLYCLNLVNVKLNLPKLNSYSMMFGATENIETIDVTIPTSQVDGFKSYVTGLHLQHLTSFIINGEEQL